MGRDAVHVQVEAEIEVRKASAKEYVGGFVKLKYRLPTTNRYSLSPSPVDSSDHVAYFYSTWIKKCDRKNFMFPMAF